VSGFGKSSAIESVSDAADADEIARFAGIVFNLSAKRHDVVIDHAVR
jgi:hypothetical protein